MRCKTLIFQTFAADDAVNKPVKRVNDDNSAGLPAGEHIVPYRYLIIDIGIYDTLVKSLIMTADEYEILFLAEIFSICLIEKPAGGTWKDHPLVLCADTVKSSKERLAFQYHTGSPSVWNVIACPVAVCCEIPEIYYPVAYKSSLHGTCHDGGCEEAFNHLGKQSENIYMHFRIPGVPSSGL